MGDELHDAIVGLLRIGQSEKRTLAAPPVTTPARSGLDALVAVLGGPHDVTPAEACDDLRELGFDVPAALDRLMGTVQEALGRAAPLDGGE